ncbi:MAG: hypothetical protein R2873_34795 [Caldilineaceae bacterium]
MQEPTVLLQQKIEKTVAALPSAGKEELASFLDYLQHKYQVETGDQVIELGGIWSGIGFEIDEEDIRALRREASEHLLERFTKLSEQ